MRRRRTLGNAPWWRSPAGRANRRELGSLASKFAGQRCFVLGNGPSLRKTDVSRLGSEVTIASNAIFLLFDEMGYQPTFLTVEDRLVAEDRAAELNGLKNLSKVFPRDLWYCLKPDPWTLYVNFLRSYDGFPRFSDSFADVAYWGGTVSYLNLQLAYFLGCNPIYLIGFDHSYVTPTTVEGSAIITSDSDDVNHFHPDYFGKGYRWHDPRVDRMTAGYEAARDFLLAKGVAVFNATPGGKLEVFERIDFNDVIADDQ